MDVAPLPPPVSAPSGAAPVPVLTAWPRSAQLATAFLAGVAASLIAVQACRYAGWGSRPTELQRDAVAAYRVDLNRADRAELVQLPGVGEGLASRIENRRREQGELRHVDDLRQVKGIGPATQERLRPYVSVHENDNAEERASVREMSSPSTGKRTIGVKKIAALSGPVNINTASVTELQKLPGIGPKISQRIVDERKKGLFKSVDDLRRVPGIGPKTLERLRPYVAVAPQASEVAASDRENRRPGQ